MLQPVAVQMFRVLVNTEGVAQAGAMFPGGGDDGSNPVDPLQPLPPVPPPPPDEAEGGNEATGVTQYHAECTSAEIASCVPPCNVEHHGYELLATIDGTDTKFSCNLAHRLYSWMGAASEGGYLGADAQSFLSAVVSGHHAVDQSKYPNDNSFAPMVFPAKTNSHPSTIGPTAIHARYVSQTFTE